MNSNRIATVCSKCGHEVKIDISTGITDGVNVWTDYICPHCGYIGKFEYRPENKIYSPDIMLSQKALLYIKTFLLFDTLEEEFKVIEKDLNALRIILEDDYLISQLKDYYENIWGGIHDQNDVDFMKQWSSEVYKNRYIQSNK